MLDQADDLRRPPTALEVADIAGDLRTLAAAFVATWGPRPGSVPVAGGDVTRAFRRWAGELGNWAGDGQVARAVSLAAGRHLCRWGKWWTDARSAARILPAPPRKVRRRAAATARQERHRARHLEAVRAADRARWHRRRARALVRRLVIIALLSAAAGT